MNARVFLLVLISALFMGAWSGDQKTMQAAIAERNHQREEAWAKASAEAAAKTEIPVAPVTMTVALPNSETTATSPDAADRSHDIPLPAGIASGKYRAVSQSGVTQILTVEATNGEDSAKHSAGRDFYTADAANGDRWYLIRIR